MLNDLKIERLVKNKEDGEKERNEMKGEGKMGKIERKERKREKEKDG